MAYNQKFGPNRKGSKHGKDMISRIMSGQDTAMSPLDNSVQYLKGMSGAMNGQKGMDGYSYGVPAEKLSSIQGSEGMSRYTKGMSRYEKDGMSRKTKGQAALDGIGGGMSRHTSEHSTEEYMDRKDAAIKKSKADKGISRYKSDAQRKAAHASMAEQKGMSRHKAGHQGYNDKLDESLAKDGKESTKKQSMKDRRDESKGAEKAKGKRAYSSDPDMDRAKATKKRVARPPSRPKAKAKKSKFPTGINPNAKKKDKGQKQPGGKTVSKKKYDKRQERAKELDKKSFDKDKKGGDGSKLRRRAGRVRARAGSVNKVKK